jgi:hypothetical protein
MDIAHQRVVAFGGLDDLPDAPCLRTFRQLESTIWISLAARSFSLAGVE